MVLTELLLLSGMSGVVYGQASPQAAGPAQEQSATMVPGDGAAVDAMPVELNVPTEGDMTSKGQGAPAVDDQLFLDMLLNEESIPILSPDEIYQTLAPPELQEPQVIEPKKTASGRIEGIEPESEVGVLSRGLLNPLGGTQPRSVKFNPINQALSTSEAILGNLSGVRGAVTSPFLTRSRKEVPLLRLGVVYFRPYLSIGLAASHTDDEGDDFGGFFQAGVSAILEESERLSGTLEYTIGIMPGSGGGGGGGGGNGLDQQLSLRTQFSFPEWPKVQFGFRLDYTGLSNVNRDVGGEVNRILATASLGASYEYSRKTSFEWDVSIPVREFSSGVSSGGVTSSFFIDNQITRKTRVGVGVAVGLLKVEGGSDEWFQQTLLRASYRPSALLTFDGSVGLELREWEDSTGLHPIFGLGATWEPRAGTEIHLAAESRIFSSATATGHNYRSTSVILEGRQRIGYRLTALASIGYEYAVYEGGDGQIRRRDNLLELSVGLAVPITKRWGWELTFSVGENDSNVRPFEFYQGVLQTSFSF